MPCVTVLLGDAEYPIHQLFPEWLVDVNESQLPEGRQDQIFFYLFHFAECDHIPAHIVKAHDGDAVVGAAYAVVKILFTAEVGAPLRKKLCVSQLHLLPDRLALHLRIVQSDFRQNSFLQGLEYSTWQLRSICNSLSFIFPRLSENRSLHFLRCRPIRRRHHRAPMGRVLVF